MTSFDLSGRVAMITGANAGIGRAIALALAEAGADIVAVGRSSCEETVAQAVAMGRRGEELRADLSTTAPVQGLVDDTVSAFGRLDILVNNAGIIRRSPTAEFQRSRLGRRRRYEPKVGVLPVSAAGRHMIERGRGKSSTSPQC